MITYHASSIRYFSQIAIDCVVQTDSDVRTGLARLSTEPITNLSIFIGLDSTKNIFNDEWIFLVLSLRASVVTIVEFHSVAVEIQQIFTSK